MTHDQCDVKPTVTFPAVGHRCRASGTKLCCIVKLAFHGADTDTDTDSTPTRSTRLYILTSDTRDFLARILTRNSVSVSVSWNAT